MSDLVSIIIPVHNSEKFLRESINSAINQTYQNIEIICINDGSNDNSMEIMDSFSDKIVVISQENQGLSSAINSGIKKMKGKWMKWLSPDDLMHPNDIEVLIKNATKLSEDTILYSNWEIIDENGKKLRKFYESNYNELSKFDFNVRLLDSQQININTTLIPSLLFEKGCKIQNLSNTVAIDYDFFLRSGIIFNVKFHLISQSLVDYRVHSDQLSHRNISLSLQYISNIKENILSELDEKDKEKYLKSLKQYQKTKTLKKKILEKSLNILINFFPSRLSDPLLVFYLNKVRNSR